MRRRLEALVVSCVLAGSIACQTSNRTEVVEPASEEQPQGLEYSELGDSLAAFDLEHAIRLMEDLQSTYGVTNASVMLAICYWRTGRACEAMAILDEIDREAIDERSEASLAVLRASVLFDSGRYEEGAAEYRRCLREYCDLIPTQTLSAIVTALDTQPEGTAEVRQLDIVPLSFVKEDSCLPSALLTLLQYWSFEVDRDGLLVQVMEDRVDQKFSEYLKASYEVQVVPFMASAETVRELVRRGYPTLLFYESLSDGEPTYHAAVVSGFDGRRGVFLMEDANWTNGFPYLRYEQVEGCRAFLIAPEKLAATAIECLTGVDEAVLLGEAFQAIDTGQVDDAEFLLKQMLAPGTSSTSWPLEGLARCASLRGDRVREIEALERAVLKKPHSGSPKTWTYLGALRVTGGEESGALECFEAAVDLYAWSCNALVMIAWMTAEEDPLEALRQCENVLEIKADFEPAQKLKISLLQGLGRHDEADEAARQFEMIDHQSVMDRDSRSGGGD